MIGLTDGIEVDDGLASPLSGASRLPNLSRQGALGPLPREWRPENHKYWARAGRYDIDICGLCGFPKSAHVEPTASVDFSAIWDKAVPYNTIRCGVEDIVHVEPTASVEAAISGEAKRGFPPRGAMLVCDPIADALARYPELAHVEPTFSDEATVSGEAKTKDPTDAYAIQKGAGPNGEDVAL